ncbi:dihydrolipoyl dehydrogenase [Verminephrobacter aporrectodeae subsp. tuberculatae]|uniref:dihydrolipoyl dehydrogenase n=1 Tax=Verminephrobacter aporrectodeae TaxID=1110389 RepID=UPI002242CC7B|nr:dihydrolipoyl dehydrogenase [Verminephrobacter aporrectodeae]MCW8205953.1 dihydrolipoyl dehydrogenase [Verminephrobacter aporrectodeae subsp. tuberculatae]
MATIDIQLPDIGDFDEVRIIELLVQAGDSIRAEQSLITVESDKASMEIPSSHAGRVKELKVKLGDKVKQGSVLLALEVQEVADAPAPAVAAAAAPASASTAAAADLECDLLVLGGGPGGYSAAFRAADLGLRVVIVERYATLGGVCLNVGCIPSKALLHVASVIDEARHLARAGVDFGAPKIDLAALRGHKEKIIGKLTGGLAAMAKMRKVTTVRGYGAFVDAHHVEVEETTGAGQQRTGNKKRIAFKKAIIAAGSQALRLPFMPEDPRVLDSSGALELATLPKRMLILGGGIIGLEMGTVYSTLGARLDVVEMQDGLMPGADRDLVKIWQKMNAGRFDRIMLQTKTVGARATPEGIEVTFAAAQEGGSAPEAQLYDLVLQAVGRAPNGRKIAAEKAGVTVTQRGFIEVDVQMRSNVAHIFAIGDVVGQPMLAHKAVHEAHVAAQVIAGELQGDKALASTAFDARVIPSVAYTDPEVAWVGLTEDQARAQGIKVRKGLFPWTASGRAIANGRDEGCTKLLFDDAPQAHGHGRILGGGIVGTHAGDMIGEIALAIEMGADALDIGKTIHPHPTLGESIGMAAEIAHGSCTDVPPQKK